MIGFEKYKTENRKQKDDNKEKSMLPTQKTGITNQLVSAWNLWRWRHRSKFEHRYTRNYV